GACAARDRLPGRTRRPGLRLQGLRGGAGGLLHPAGRPAGVPLLAARRAAHLPLARGGRRRRRPPARGRPHPHGDRTVTIVWVVLHSFGMVLWIGGSLAAVAAAGAASRLEPAALLGLVRGLAPVYRWLVGPGLSLTTASGLLLALGM